MWLGGRPAPRVGLMRGSAKRTGARAAEANLAGRFGARGIDAISSAKVAAEQFINALLGEHAVRG